jgi:RNA polymerase sigma-70 factor (ECF subfamily)
MVTMQHQDKEGDLVEMETKDDGMLPDESIVHQEALGMVRLSLETLDLRSRELVRLKFEEDMTYRQIAEKTGLSVSNVGYVLHHAVKSLSIELKKLGVGT